MKTQEAELFCKSSIDRMLKNSQTKVIFPVITLALLQEFADSGKTIFTDGEIKRLYEKTVHDLTDFLGHDVHIGGKYYDAYPSRNLPRYQVLKTVASMTYELLEPYTQFAQTLCLWIRKRIRDHITSRLGLVPQFHDAKTRLDFASSKEGFINLLTEQINKTPANFEIFSFAVLKVHLDKFACRIYRDTRTSSHDGGVDLSTNFGVVYQIKKFDGNTQAD